MAGIAGPNLVTDGLVLCLDANNGISHAGGDTTWTDPVGSNDGTLVNEPALESDFVSSAEVTGGTVGVFGDYIVHTFTSNGNFVTNVPLEYEALIVAGGGGGGYNLGGGGGGGGVVHLTGNTVTAATYAMVVGGGGSSDGNGSDSTGFGSTANAGGAGKGYADEIGNDGGSGGGAGSSGSYASAGGSATGSSLGGNTGTIYGNDGGGQTEARTGTPTSARGGGGAGAAGADESPNTTDGGTGGAGIQINIDGNNYYWAGGGGGSAYSAYGGGDGGLGGGGGGSTNAGGGINGDGGTGGKNDGADSTSDPGGAGGANTGSGGGGGNYSTGNGGAGGSGIVIVRYHRKYADRKFYFDLNGTDQIVDLGADVSVSADNVGWAAEFWFRTDSASTLQAFSSSDNDSLNANWMNLYQSKIQLWNVSPGYWKMGSTTIQNNTWYQVVYVCKSGGTQYQFYINGVAEGGDHVSNTWVASYSSLDIRYIGTYNYNSSKSRYWNGDFSTVRIYDREITAAEVLQNFEANKGRFGL